MDPTRDNPLIRIKAFLDGLGIFTLFAVILLLILGIGALFGWFRKGEEPEDAAGDIRYEISAEVKAEQDAFLSKEQIHGTVGTVAGSLVASKPVAVEKPEQLVPGSETAEKIAGAPKLDTTDIDAAGDPEAPIDPAQMEIGKTQYLVCGACHGQNGEGGPAGPPLAGSEWVTGPVSNLIIIQLRGLKGPIEVAGKLYDNFPAGMTPMAYQTDEQIAGVLTYIRNSFGNKAPAVKPEQVAAMRGEVGKPQATVEELTKP
jgi:mono/diheme cytochrome c family protein